MVSGELMTSVDDIVNHTLTFVISSGSDHFVVNEEYKEPRNFWSFTRVHLKFSNDYKEILGVSCRRVDFYLLPSGADQGGFAWIAEKEGLVMEDVEPKTGWRWVITSITFREPDVSTFLIPRGVEKK